MAHFSFDITGFCSLRFYSVKYSTHRTASSRGINMTFRLFLCSLMLLAGCADPYGACEKGALDVGNGIAAGMKTIDQLRASGAISIQEETNVLGYFEFANKADGAFGACAQAAHTAGSKSGSYTACVQIFQTALASPQQLALIHVTNPTSQQQIEAVVSGLTIGATAILTALGGK